MNDFDFDKSFSDDLRKERFEEPAEANWQRLSASLDSLDRRRTWQKRLLFGGLPLLIATGLALFFSSEWQAADRRAAQLEIRVVELERQVFSKEKEGGAETVFSEGDLMERENLVPAFRQPHPRSLLQGEGRHDSQHRFSPPPGVGVGVDAHQTENSLKNVAAESSNPTIEKSDFENRQPTEIQKMETTESTTQFIDKLTELPRKSPNSIEFQRKLIFQPVSKLAEKPVRPLKTPRFAAGLTGGLVASDGHESWPGEGWSGGLGVQYLLRKKWRLTGGIEWDQAEFESRFGGFPDVPPPPNPGDEFHRAVHSQAEMTVLLGVRRQFRVEKRLQPFVSLAWAGIQPVDSETEFHFINPVSGQRSSLRLPSENSRHFDAASLRLGLGGSWKLRPRLELGLQTGWQQSFDHQKNSQPGSQFSATASLFRFF